LKFVAQDPNGEIKKVPRQSLNVVLAVWIVFPLLLELVAWLSNCEVRDWLNATENDGQELRMAVPAECSHDINEIDVRLV
jgi:hypothetical protein